MALFPRGILATCVLPWDDMGRLCEDLLRAEVRENLRHTKLLYVMGTAGEGYALDDDTYEQVVRVFASEMRAGGAEPMVGIISLSVQEVHRRIARAESLGVRLFQVSLPSWGPCTEREILTFFDEICGKHPSCDFLHYNLLRARVLVTPSHYARISAAHPNLVATKNTTDSISFLSLLMKAAPGVRHFLADVAFPYGCLLGACGMLISIASVNWRTALRYYALAAEKAPEALEMQQELAAMVDDLRRLADPFTHMDGGFDKMYTKLALPAFPLRLLPPYDGVPDEVFRNFQALLAEKYPRWSPA